MKTKTKKRKGKKDIKNVFAYARVSTVEQAEKDLSLPAQLDAIRRYCRERGYTIVHEYEEPGASGRDEHRKTFKRMLEDVLAPSSEIDAIIVYQTSRFMRNAGKARIFKDTLSRRGISVLSVCQEVTDDPMGKLIEGVFELIDEYESAVNGMRTTAAMRENAKQGFLNGSKTPYGFNAEKIEVRPDVFKRKLTPNLDEANLLVEIMRLYVNDHGAKKVARDLNARGVLYRGGKPWTKNLILKVLEEPAAIGRYYWGKTDTESGTPTDPEDWIEIPCTPVVETDLFNLVQQVRGKRDPKVNPGRTSSSPLLLASLIFCGKCGKSYTLESSGKTATNGTRPYRYYHCSGFVRVGKEDCPGFRHPAEKLEQAVLKHIAENIFTEERIKTLLKDLVEDAGVLRQKGDDQRKEWERQLKEVERAIARWEAAFESGEMPADLGMDRVRELRSKRAELTETLKKVVPIQAPPPHLYKQETIQSFQKMLRDVFLSGEHAMTRNYLRMLVDRIVVHDEYIEVVARTQGALALMASAPSATVFTATGAVPTSVNGWLRIGSRSLTRSRGSRRDGFARLAASRKVRTPANPGGWAAWTGTLSRIRTVPRGTQARLPLRLQPQAWRARRSAGPTRW